MGLQIEPFDGIPIELHGSEIAHSIGPFLPPPHGTLRKPGREDMTHMSLSTDGNIQTQILGILLVFNPFPVMGEIDREVLEAFLFSRILALRESVAQYFSHRFSIPFP